LYKPIKDKVHLMTSKKPGPETIVDKLLAGGAAGGLAAFIGNPSDLLKARMQADASGRMGTFSHIKDIFNSKGFLGFWSGI